MSGILTLIPTPIDDINTLNPETKEIILNKVNNGCIILIEEERVGRRRWLNYGLPRDCIEEFVLFNEHTQGELSPLMIKELKAGKDIILMSDCGLPAFCDPGQLLVDLCHKNKVKVTATAFSNSIALAVALSGFPHARFIFEGFIPIKKPERSSALKRILKQPEMSILMDTPYRLVRVLEELELLGAKRQIFVGLDLNKVDEQLYRGAISAIKEKLSNSKREFILIIGPK